MGGGGGSCYWKKYTFLRTANFTLLKNVVKFLTNNNHYLCKRQQSCLFTHKHTHKGFRDPLAYLGDQNSHLGLRETHHLVIGSRNPSLAQQETDEREPSLIKNWSADVLPLHFPLRRIFSASEAFMPMRHSFRSSLK